MIRLDRTALVAALALLSCCIAERARGDQPREGTPRLEKADLKPNPAGVKPGLTEPQP